MVINLSILLTDLKNNSRISLHAALVNTHFQFRCARNKRQFSFPTGFIETRRAQKQVLKRWIFEIVMIAAEELHTLCSNKWISRELVHPNSWRFVWIFTALLVRFSSNAITTSPFHRRTSLHPHFQQWGQKSRTSNACKILNFNRENLKFWNLEFWKADFKISNKTISLHRHFQKL